MTNENPNHQPPTEYRSSLERHAQTLILSVVTGLILWVGVSVTGTRESLARLEARVESMDATMKELKDARNSVYTRVEADRTHAEIERRLQGVENRLSQLERAR